MSNQYDIHDRPTVPYMWAQTLRVDNHDGTWRTATCDPCSNEAVTYDTSSGNWVCQYCASMRDDDYTWIKDK